MTTPKRFDSATTQCESRVPYLSKTEETGVEALAEVPVGDVGEDARHRLVVELVDGDDLQVAREAARDVVAPTARGTHRAHEQLKRQTRRARHWRFLFATFAHTRVSSASHRLCSLVQTRVQHPLTFHTPHTTGTQWEPGAFVKRSKTYHISEENLGRVLLVVPVRVIDPLPQQLDRGLRAIHFFGRHVQVICEHDEYNAFVSRQGSEMSVSARGGLNVPPQQHSMQVVNCDSVA